MAIAHSTTTTATAANASSTTISSFVVTGTDPVLVVKVATKGTVTVTGVTWNGSENFTEVITDINGNARSTLLVLPNPTATTANVVVSLSGNSRHVSAVSLYTGVDQVAAIRSGTANSANGTNDNPSTSVTGVSGDMNVDSMCQVSAGPDTISAQSGTSRSDTAATGGGTDTRGSSQELAATGGADTMSYTLSGSDNWAITAAALMPPQPITGSGALLSQSATTSGTAEITKTGSGSLLSQSATTSGTADIVKTGSGSLLSQSASTAGEGTVATVISGSGVLLSQSATMAGTAEIVKTSTGSLLSQSATVSGTAEVEKTATGSLLSQSATTSGTAEVVKTGSGSLLSQSASTAGTAEITKTSTGSLLSQSATTSGSAQIVKTGSGALLSQSATTSGTGTVSAGVTGSGVLLSQSATMAGTATLTPLPRISLCLADRNGVVLPNLTLLSWAWFDDVDPNDFVAPTDKGQTEITDSTGLLEIGLPNSSLVAGQEGTLVLRSDSGTSTAAYNLEIV